MDSDGFIRELSRADQRIAEVKERARQECFRPLSDRGPFGLMQEAEEALRAGLEANDRDLMFDSLVYLRWAIDDLCERIANGTAQLFIKKETDTPRVTGNTHGGNDDAN